MKKPGHPRSPEEIADMESYVDEPTANYVARELLRAIEKVDEKDTDEECVAELKERLAELETELGEEKLRAWLPGIKSKIETMMTRVKNPVVQHGYELVIREINQRLLS